MTLKKPIRTLVWDIPTRIFHWSLVTAVAYAWFAVEILEDMEQHFLAGYCVLTLILFRLLWGFLGTAYVRFSNFLYSPKSIFNYATTLRQRDSTSYLGHNPLGGLAVLAMLLVLLVQALSGLFNSDDYFYGPLSGLVSDSLRGTLGNIHEINFDIITGLVAVHIAAVIFYLTYKKQALLSAMFTGNKVVPGPTGDQTKTDDTKASFERSSSSIKCSRSSIESSRLLLALVVFAVCAAGVYFIATGFTDTLPSSEFDYSF